MVADLGSGTGFYTDDVAAAAGTVYAVDDAVQLCEGAGITVHRAEDRRETFVLEGRL